MAHVNIEAVGDGVYRVPIPVPFPMKYVYCYVCRTFRRR
ncbi:hypothetical protein TGS27_1553 [Geobacillus stearothermophilus]|uniref:Uncharacterized protein n=1 Tax=Geobacillus stearothermophilus TaxID=1422 RepID=A0A150MPD0_GEOSE|nr:hypothetical protein GS8_2520 [Geobacillus stearothermophilus]KYD26301.1 hypothetical protein B4109_1637 [Geobacillus stearothermophilus]OAO81780.1 hypothetical protein TGS27_1553 [Geobacillus stearothermophilus]